MRRGLLIGFTLWLWASACTADATLKPFIAGSLDEITSQRQGRAFVLVLWSKDCPPCLRELARIGTLENRLARDLVLVSTDAITNANAVVSLLGEYNLHQLENWIFSDPVIERSRYRIDPEWYGELPRAYFYDTTHQRTAYSGMIEQQTLENWLTGQQSLITSNMEP